MEHDSKNSIQDLERQLFVLKQVVAIMEDTGNTIIDNNLEKEESIKTDNRDCSLCRKRGIKNGR